MSDEMKVSFMVEIEGCSAEKGKRCPHLCKTSVLGGNEYCTKASVEEQYRVTFNNRYKLTESCPAVKKQFEALT